MGVILNKNEIVAGVDLGSSVVRVIIGRLDAYGRIEILGFSEEPFEGIRHGVITDLKATANVAEKNILVAEEQANIEITQIVVNIGGDHAYSYNHKSKVVIRHHDKKIKNHDLYEVVYSQKNLHIQDTFDVMHTLVKNFEVDDVEDISQPLSMVANELHANVHLFLGRHNLIQNVYNVFESIGIHVEAVYPNAYLVGEAILADEEKDLGVICLDIGAQSTDVITYQKGEVFHSFSIPLGSAYLIEKISRQFCISKEHAQDIMEKYAYVGEIGIGEDREILLQNIAKASYSKIKGEELKSISQLAVENILEKIDLRLSQEDLKTHASAGIVLTGGMAYLKGLTKVAQEVFKKPVRLASVDHPIAGNEAIRLKGYQYPLCCGLIRVTREVRDNTLIKVPSWVERFKHIIGVFFAELF